MGFVTPGRLFSLLRDPSVCLLSVCLFFLPRCACLTPTPGGGKGAAAAREGEGKERGVFPLT